MKKFSFLIYIASACILILSALFISPVGKQKTAQAASYLRLNEITALATDGDSIIAAEKSGIAVLNKDGKAQKRITLDSVIDIGVHGGTIYALTDTAVYTVNTENGTANQLVTVAGQLYLECSEGGFLTADEGEVHAYSYEDGSLDSSTPINGSIRGLHCVDNGVFYAVGSYRSSLYKVGEPQPVIENASFYSSPVHSNGSWYAIARNGSVVLLSQTGAAQITDNCYAVAVTAAESGVYYATDRGEIYHYDGNESTLIAASDSNEYGFYSTPIYAAARFSKAYICDYHNDRIAVISDKTEYLPFTRPTAVSVDNASNLFVAHSIGKISRVAPDGTVTETFETTSQITAIATTADNALYAVFDNTLYRIENGEKVKIEVDVPSLSVSFGTEKLAYSKGSTVRFFNGTTLFDAAMQITSFAVDAADSCYFISGNSLYKRTADGTVSTLSDTLSGNGCFVTISKATTSLAAYGDLIVTDGGASTVSVITAQSAGVVVPTANPAVTPYDNENIIHTLLFDSSLYATPHEAEVKINLKAGTEIIVAKADIESNSGLSYCCYEDQIGKRLVFGYLFKSNLGTPEEYKAAPASTGILYAGNANLYSLPSVYSDKAVENMAKGTELALLPFADYSTESGKWYRASDANGNIGYVPANTVSVRGFIPDGIRPQYNAEIIANGDIVVAAVYEEINGEMIKIEGEFLTVGTQVEVVGSFDTSEKYTQIKYFDEDLGTLTCFVETAHVDYNSFSIVQVIAIVIVVVTVILLGVLLLRIYAKKRKL